MEPRPIHKLLVANRGEIAVRILRACRELGIATVAVYSQADRYARHVFLANEAVCIGPPPPGESYLRGDRILEAAHQTGADAIHPGYGFLAENPEFAQAVLEAHLTWIGPSPEAIRIMGSKTAARAQAEEAGVPVIPGYQASQDNTELQAAAGELGYPVLVKAVAGGGGKGMRLVPTPEEMLPALEAARREAQNAFGDERIYLEKVLTRARHVEIQIFGDHQGQVLHLGERDCSVQRRHQKIVEEAPSPAVSPELRRQMGEAAVALARSVDYVNAGTVEFLLDETTGAFYFLEMNTRLQVEHPVTERVTGVDLVHWQIRVASGEPLRLAQDEIRPRGHAIECRIYAEDPLHGFVPSTGHLKLVREPMGPGIRVDSGVDSGDALTRFYDPLIAKLVVHGRDRATALKRMEQALREYVVLGEVTTNIPFLRDVITHPVFQAGQALTTFVDDYFADWHPVEGPIPDAALVAAALAQVLEPEPPDAGALPATQDPFSPWRRLQGWY